MFNFRSMFNSKQREPEGLEELLRMMTNGDKPNSKPAKPGKVKITQIEVPSDFVTQLVETALEQFDVIDGIRSSAQEQVEQIRQSAQRQVDEALEQIRQDRRDARAKERSKSMIEMEVREFINGQIYAFQLTHQALAEYTGRYKEQIEYIPREVVDAVNHYSNGNVHSCGDPDCLPDKVHQTLRRYDEIKQLAEILMANMDDEEYRRWAEEENEGDEDMPVEEVAEQAAD